MTGVAKLAFKYGKSEAEAEREVRNYLMREGVVKEEVVVAEKEMVLKKEEVALAVENKRVIGIAKKVDTLNKATKVICLTDEFRTEGTRRTVRKRIKRKSLKDAAKLSRPFTRGSPVEYIKRTGR